MEIKEMLESIQSDWKAFRDVNEKREKEVKLLGEASHETKLELERINKALDDTAKTISEFKITTTGNTDTNVFKPSFSKFLRYGAKSLTPAESKALYAGVDTGAGYLIAPPEMVRELLKDIVEVSPIRQHARAVQISQGNSLIWPKKTGNAAAAWVAESGTRSERTGLTYGQEDISTHEMYHEVHLSRQLLEDAAFSPEQEMMLEFVEQFALLEGTGFVSGDSVGKPEGILTNSDVGTTNSGSAGAFTADGLIDLFYALKDAYASNGKWYMRRASISEIRQLKDGSGAYLWQPSLQEGQPSMLLGHPVIETVDMPAIASATKSALFGDLQKAYLIADKIQMHLIRDEVTEADVGNVRFIARRRVGGQIILPEAIRIQVLSA